MEERKRRRVLDFMIVWLGTISLFEAAFQRSWVSFIEIDALMLAYMQIM